MTENAKVRPARIQVSGLPAIDACRTTKSNASVSLTCQMKPPRTATCFLNAKLARVAELGHGAHVPSVWSFDDRAKKDFGKVLPCQFGSDVDLLISIALLPLALAIMRPSLCASQKASPAMMLPPKRVDQPGSNWSLAPHRYAHEKER